ncbi:MAG: YbhB/YbcL family Raf kinase inhibitor-like protein [Dehalococcoidia bacterium]|nr:YbhB/YbcL family Raf kinase inhibitor-like protein [Dehalococcoidia bacterium]
MRNIHLLLTLFVAAVLIALLLAGCSSDEKGGDADTGAVAAASGQAAGQGDAAAASVDTGYVIQQQFDSSIVFTSPVFNAKRRIPKKHTCTRLSSNEPNISPPLAWENLPGAAVSLALTMDSREVEGAPRVHWVMWNMSPSLTGLSDGIEHTEVLPDGTAQGTNGIGEVGYRGPCPPDIISIMGGSGKKSGNNAMRAIEKYFFTIYALDTKLSLPPSTTKNSLLEAIDGHILASGELVGERQGKLIMSEQQ